MEFTARQIAEILQGEIEGNPDAFVNKVSRIEEADEKSLSFLANPKYTPFIYETGASIVLVNKDFKADKNIHPTLIRVDDAYSALARILEAYNELKKNKSGISKNASVASTAKLGKNIYLGDFAVVGENCVIGDNVKIYPNTVLGDNVNIGDNTTLYIGVKIYDDNRIGRNCTLHAGVIIGGDGFGFAPQDDNNYKKVAQIGNVIIEDNVEIGANTTIDRATIGSTIIRKGVKLDNLIQIAHNVEIGENTVIAAQTGISGSTKVGKNCMIGGQVGLVGHITIADEVKIAAQAGISNSIKEKGAIVIGSPAFDLKSFKRSYIYFKSLPEMAQKLNKLEKEFKKR